MMRHLTRWLLVVALVACPARGQAQERAVCAVARPGAVVVYGEVEQQLVVSANDLAGMTQASIPGEPHGGTPGTYTGPALGEILSRAGVRMGADLRGAALARYVVVEAADGYRAVFALAELDPLFRSAVPILAHRKDGQPLDGDAGPFQVIVPGEQRHARWVRQVVCLRLARDAGAV
ncbi:MAG: molybdopterin-dependent oxidoreductase [Longimicrobiales bacterium]